MFNLNPFLFLALRFISPFLLLAYGKMIDGTFCSTGIYDMIQNTGTISFNVVLGIEESLTKVIFINENRIDKS